MNLINMNMDHEWFTCGGFAFAVTSITYGRIWGNLASNLSKLASRLSVQANSTKSTIIGDPCPLKCKRAGPNSSLTAEQFSWITQYT